MSQFAAIKNDASNRLTSVRRSRSAFHTRPRAPTNATMIPHTTTDHTARCAVISSAPAGSSACIRSGNVPHTRYAPAPYARPGLLKGSLTLRLCHPYYAHTADARAALHSRLVSYTCFRSKNPTTWSVVRTLGWPAGSWAWGLNAGLLSTDTHK